MPKALVRQIDSKQMEWSFEPSVCRPPTIVEYVEPLEATDSYVRSMQSSWYEDMINGPAYSFAPPVIADADRTHERLFGTDTPLEAVVRRRRDAGDGCELPLWSPDCQRPPSVDDFTRTHRNIHGDELPTFKPPAPPDFNEPQTTILGPHLLPPVCCPHPGRSCSPVTNEQFERTKYNIIGPQKPVPLRLPPRPDDFIDSQRKLFGPATPIPLRFPRQTSGFDDTKRNLFGPPLPYCARPPNPAPMHLLENTFEHLFGKTVMRVPPRTVTPPPAQRQNIDVLSMAERSYTPPRFQPRPETFFGNTYNHLFGRKTPVIPNSQHRQVLLPSAMSTEQRPNVGLGLR